MYLFNNIHIYENLNIYCIFCVKILNSTWISKNKTTLIDYIIYGIPIILKTFLTSNIKIT